MAKYILFDLDGTLTDPKEGITKSVQYALKKHGINVTNRDELCSFIGPPLKDSFINEFGFDKYTADAAVAGYREYFSDKGIFENEVYDGITEMLQVLHNAGRVLILATSKPWVYAEKILKHFKLHDYFSFIGGSELNGDRTKKSEVIEYALAQCGISDLDNAVMVGDRKHDIIGAKTVGISSIGVLYGYGSYEELTNAGADLTAESPAKLSELLL